MQDGDSFSIFVFMHLSMFSPRGGGPGIPGGFDILPNSRVNFPAMGTISCVKCPSPRRKIFAMFS